MVRALRVPVEKLRRKEIDSLVDRVTWIAREKGSSPHPDALISLIADGFHEELGILAEPGALTTREARDIDARVDATASRGWIRGKGRRATEQVRALHPTAGGMLRPVIRCDRRHRHVQAIVLGGDFFAFPGRGILDLEASLKGARVEDVRPIVQAFFEEGRVEIPGIGPGDVVQAITEALDRDRAGSLGLTTVQANATFAVGGRLADVARIRPTHLLLPYCAKPLDCDTRRHDHCERCGECAMADAFEAGEQAGLEVLCITSFEHLMQTLTGLAVKGAPAFLGSCCEAFYVKHRLDMEAAGVPGILVDVASNETCYDLGKATVAYQGEWEGLSELDIDLVRTIIAAAGRRE
jgi:lipoate-protein ligase A